MSGLGNLLDQKFYNIRILFIMFIHKFKFKYTRNSNTYKRRAHSVDIQINYKYKLKTDTQQINNFYLHKISKQSINILSLSISSHILYIITNKSYFNYRQLAHGRKSERKNRRTLTTHIPIHSYPHLLIYIHLHMFLYTTLSL